MTSEELVGKIKAGEDCKENMRELYSQNIPLIEKISRKYAAVCGIDMFEDLKQESYIVLSKAVECFVYNKGSFTALYEIMLDRALYRYINQNCCSIRIPENKKAEIAKEELSEYSTLLRIGSLNKTVEGSDGDLFEIIDTVSYEEPPFKTENDIVEQEAGEQISKQLWGEVNGLPEKYAEVINLYYKLGLTFVQIGEKLGISKSSAQCRHAEALKRLKKNRKIASMVPGIRPNEAYSEGLKGTGLKTFMSFGSSNVERIVEKHIDMALKNRFRCHKSI